MQPCATRKEDVTHRDWLLIDADPVRPSGISSTKEEKAAALEMLQEVASYLKNEGWPSPVTADSGNGFHALYHLDLPNTPEVETAVRNVLKHLDKKFSNDKVKVDTSVHDPNRITKVYGTMTGKGEPTVDRPHRRSAIRRVPDKIVPVSLEQMMSLIPKKSGIVIKKNQSQNQSQLPPVTVEKMEQFFEFYGINHNNAQEQAEGGLMWLPAP